MEAFISYANSRDVSYSEVSCVTILTWDVLVMFSQEVSTRTHTSSWGQGQSLIGSCARST